MPKKTTSKTNADIDPRLIQYGEKLRQIRISKGYSSYEFFAWENKISRIQYYKMEKGSNFTMKSLLRVLDALEITPQEFFKD
jgi:hypothetical protein